MCKSKKAAKTAVGVATWAMPAAPWIYINDPTSNGQVVNQLVKLLPSSFLVSLIHNVKHLEFRATQTNPKFSVNVMRDTLTDDQTEEKEDAMRIMKASAMKAGANCVTVNVMTDPSKLAESASTKSINHLNVAASPDAGKSIYAWLFTTLTIRETLYLIPDSDMKKIDTTLFPQYEYCSIKDSRTRPKDAKIQYVGLILTKPQVIEGNKLVWTVADKTGVANFYFQHRGDHSQYTWDWVMNLKPGDRKSLPRMPMVLVKERKRISLVKAPFRAVATVIGGTGYVVRSTGKGICKVGKAMRMGSSGEWVLEADVAANTKKVAVSQTGKPRTEPSKEAAKQSGNNINEKSVKTWDDGASVASTEAGSENSEKVKEFL